MDQFFFKRVELWVVGLVLVAAFFVMILFGAIVLDEERGVEELRGDHFGMIGDAALALAEIPENARQALKRVGKPDPTMISHPALSVDHDVADGWSWAQPPGSGGLDGYLLLSRYDGDRTRHVVELVSLETGETLRSWSPEPEALLANVTRRPEYDRWVFEDLWNNAYFRFVHPYLTEAGQLLVKDHNTPFFMMSACGEIQWLQDEHLFHHSTASDGEGGFWAPSIMVESQTEDISPRFLRDALVRVDENGEVTFKEPLDEVLRENGLRHLLVTGNHFYHDPMHLNDIEPVLADGPHWQKGDLFMSLRNPSLVMLYRPSTREVVWSKAGPWLSQHDVDILDDHRIAVFNNNAFNLGFGPDIDGVSETVIYDFRTASVETPFSAVFERHDVLASTEGLQDFTPSGHLIFEETTRGRVFVVDDTAEVVATFLNRAENGEIYTLGWSRYVHQAHGEKALEAITESGC